MAATLDTLDFRDSRALNRQLVTALADSLDLPAYPLRRAEPGQTLAPSASRLPSLPLVVTGSIDAVIHVGTQGNMVIPISFEVGELGMVSTLFSGQPSHAGLVAGPDLSLRWIPVPDIEQGLLQNRERLVLLVRFLAQRLREVQLRERNWLERGVTERVCATLARSMRDAPRRADGSCRLETTHEHLAARCGVSRPKLSMELKRLEQSGLLVLRRGTIEILQPEHFSPLD
ncbi:Crp/Fnr family transcriptional regulator [Comamonadaceae bacterium G21597-S1]|nr:Crp/Fnr family transcriptional regulator [Comamonadaceae bacterium G21597-S1]